MSFSVQANPDDMDQFASDLQYFSSQLNDNIAALNGAFGRLGETWLDPEHARYAEEFQETMYVLAQFIQATDEQIPFLRRKAQRLRDFINQR